MSENKRILIWDTESATEANIEVYDFLIPGPHLYNTQSCIFKAKIVAGCTADVRVAIMALWHLFCPNLMVPVVNGHGAYLFNDLRENYAALFGTGCIYRWRIRSDAGDAPSPKYGWCRTEKSNALIGGEALGLIAAQVYKDEMADAVAHVS